MSTFSGLPVDTTFRPVAAPNERERRAVYSVHGGILRTLERFAAERRLTR